MRILLFSRFCKKGSAVELCRRGILVTTMAVLSVLAGGLLVTGYWFGRQEAVLVAQQQPMRDLREQLQSDRNRLQVTRRELEDNLDALALRLGRLQSDVFRLDALGERVVEHAKLSADEFDFRNPPPLGGDSEGGDGRSLSFPDLHHSLDQLAAQLEAREGQMDALEDLLLTRNVAEDALPAGKPVTRGWISSRYGMRIHPLSGKKKFHRGLDIAGPMGSDVKAVAAGVVTSSRRKSGYGWMVEINHGNGYVTRYAHNEKNLVREGDRVRKGQIIALLGSTGRSTGPHVHFEVLRNGKTVNPARYLASVR